VGLTGVVTEMVAGAPGRRSRPATASFGAVPVLPEPVWSARAPSHRRTLDVVGLLTVFLVLMVGIPSTLAFKTLGANGTPANLLAILFLVWWLCSRLVPSLGGARGRQPIRWAFGLFAVAIICSYAAAFTRPIAPAEIRSADRGLLVLAAWAGLALITADGIDRRERLDTLVRRVANAGTFLAGVAILQFATRRELVDYIHIPGLSPTGTAYAFRQYGGTLDRVAGTAAHPIELGVVLAMVFPLALHVALTAPTGRRVVRWFGLAMISAAIFMSFSRSGILGLLAVGLMLLPTWPRSRRRRAFLVTPMFLVGMRLMVKGLIGTMISLFRNLGQDNSIQGRAERRHIALSYVHLTPVFGRGFGTFIVDQYVLLDNSYLGVVIEVGYFGLAALVVLFLTGIFTARGARRRTSDEDTRHLAQCLASSVLVMMVAFATYDGIAYTMGSSLLFLMLGMCGALWRLVNQQDSGSDGLLATSGSRFAASGRPPCGERQLVLPWSIPA
jgi:hypothetical protein